MEAKDFNMVVDEIFGECKSILTSKSKEYSNDHDRLIAFKKAAAIQGITPTEALAGMMCKHTTSVYEMISSKKKYTKNKWKEKVIDHTCYLVLLMALLQEEGFKEEKSE